MLATNETHGRDNGSTSHDGPPILHNPFPVGSQRWGCVAMPVGGRHDASPAGQPFYQPLAEWPAARAALEGADR